jgi:hypothetical protein
MARLDKVLRRKMKKTMLYNNGKLFWKPGQRLEGKEAGYMCNGYRMIQIDNLPYSRARLVVLYHTGRIPKGQVRHINGERIDDRLENLRYDS